MSGLNGPAKRAVERVKGLRRITNLEEYGDKPREIPWEEDPYSVARDMLDMAECVRRGSTYSGVVTAEFVADILETYAKRVEKLR